MQMKIKMCSSQQFAVAVLFICFNICAPTADASPIGWEFAVTLRDRVLFLDDRWRQTSSAAHEFDQLKALAFDEAEEKIYFHDRIHEESSIFSLRRDALVASHVVEQAVQRTGNDSVSGMAYDALNRNLFWTDLTQRKILFVSIDAPQPNQPSVLVDLSQELGVPDDIVVDICRRQVYWTNRRINHASVERISVNGTGRQTLVTENIDFPRGIAIDHKTDRIYWIDDKNGISFAVESARLDGSDRQLVVKGRDQNPNKLAITENTIYWTDVGNNAVWSYPKPTFNKPATNLTEIQPEPTKVISFQDNVYGIVARTGFYQHLQGDEHCASTVRKVKENMENVLMNKPHERSPVEKHADRLEKEHCLNNATFGAKSNFCICPTGYKGARCEISECHNYCVHGTCEITIDGYPKCYCQPDFYGIRCENHKCNGHCLNGGQCSVDHDSGELHCDCPVNFTGKRCEHNETAHCGSYCLHLKEHPDAFVPASCVDICEDLKLSNATIVTEYQSESACSALTVGSDSMYLILSAVVLLSLLLVVLIVHGVRLIWKPKRPRIKKTFVVRKQARLNSSSDTPLTNRPLATEQCEITIENCCNMNVCETPCFDPKLVQQHFSASDRKAPRVKEDKKILIHNMEDDLLS